jgi:hypothetical protein
MTRAAATAYTLAEAATGAQVVSGGIQAGGRSVLRQCIDVYCGVGAAEVARDQRVSARADALAGRAWRPRSFGSLERALPVRWCAPCARKSAIRSARFSTTGVSQRLSPQSAGHVAPLNSRSNAMDGDAKLPASVMRRTGAPRAEHGQSV